MAHTVTNIEAFDILASGAGGARIWTKNLGSLNPNFIGGGFQRTGQYSFLQVGQSYLQVPLVFQTSGLPFGGGVFTYVGSLVRVYYQPNFVAPTTTTRLVTLSRNAGGPIVVATVEIDNLMQLSLNGVKAGVPTTLVLGGGGSYYMLELKNDSANGAELRINGVTEVTVPGPTGRTDFIQLGDERATATGFHLFDDLLAEADRNNGALVDFPGHGRVIRLLPTSNGTDNAWLDGGAGNKWDSVDEVIADDDGSYAHNNAVAAAQTFNVQNLAGIPVGEEVRALRVSSHCRNDVLSPVWVYARLRSGGTVEETATTATGSGTYISRGAKVWQNDPNTGLPWTQAAVNAVEAGLRIATPNGRTGRITLQETLVEYGIPFPVPAGRPKINPVTVGGPGPTQINPPSLGG